jgi:fatty acid desaturase
MTEPFAGARDASPWFIERELGRFAPSKSGDRPMVLNMLTIQPLIALVAGILILIVPRILNFIVAIYLILVGVTGLWPHLTMMR